MGGNHINSTQKKTTHCEGTKQLTDPHSVMTQRLKLLSDREFKVISINTFKGSNGKVEQYAKSDGHCQHR